MPVDVALVQEVTDELVEADVVVDESARGHGVGAALTLAAIELAQAAGARTIDLTSRPSREAANRLYERLGFELRDSRVYRFSAQRRAG